MIAAENVERQIAILVIVAVEEAAELTAVQREVGAVQVQDDALGRDDVLLHEGVHEEPLHGVEVGHGLLVPAGGVGADGRKFETVEGALAGQGLALVAGPDALLALRIVLADQHGQERIVAKAVVVDEVFVAQGRRALLGRDRSGGARRGRDRGDR